MASEQNEVNALIEEGDRYEMFLEQGGSYSEGIFRRWVVLALLFLLRRARWEIESR